jgi:hypothetical protein
MMEPGERLARRLAGLHRQASPGRIDQDDGVHGPYSPSLGDRGSCTFYINIDSGHLALERFLEMVTSACDGRYGPERRNDVADRWLRAPEA